MIASSETSIPSLTPLVGLSDGNIGNDSSLRVLDELDALLAACMGCRTGCHRPDGATYTSRNSGQVRSSDLRQHVIELICILGSRLLLVLLVVLLAHLRRIFVDNMTGATEEREGRASTTRRISDNFWKR
jgi:hypothetical protein